VDSENQDLLLNLKSIQFIGNHYKIRSSEKQKDKEMREAEMKKRFKEMKAKEQITYTSHYQLFMK